MTPDGEILALTEAYANGVLDADGAARLEQLLLNDAEARRQFRRYLSVDAALHEHGAHALQGSSAGPRLLGQLQELIEARGDGDAACARPGRRRWTRLAIAAAAAVGAIGIIITASLLSSRSQRADQDAVAAAVATLEQPSGDVSVLAADGRVRPVTSKAALGAGDTVRTAGGESFTVLTYPDGTRLTLVANTSVTFGEPPTKSIVVHHGTLAASVRPQPQGKRLVLATPSAELQVLGTKFVLEALANRTDLRVSDGRVRLVRLADGNAVEVAGGQQAVITDQNELLVRPIPILPMTWEADFEDALPEGWQSGQRVTQGLPAGSRGAVRAVPDKNPEDGQPQYVIRTQEEWCHGLFAVGKNSHLHFTFKTDNSDWINILLLTRTSEPQEFRYSGNYLLRDFPKGTAGQWHTVSIPLAEFKRIHGGDETLEEVVPYTLVFAATGADRGLVIDRVWVTPDGPGEVALKTVQ
jgi:ferric-dicitrate binding protein FerR (iron transport regulator)